MRIGKPATSVSTLAAIALAVLMSGCQQGTSDGATSAATPSQTQAEQPTLTAEDRDAIAEDLAEIASLNGITDPPDIDIVRVVSQAEWPQTFADCMTAAGFPTKLYGQGTVTDIPAGQEDASNLANYTCWAKYPVDPQQNMENFTDEQKTIIYQYLTQTLVTCLEEQGHTVDDVPSEEVFMDQFTSTPPWNPYLQIYETVTSQAETEALTAACPPNTPPELIYGD